MCGIDSDNAKLVGLLCSVNSPFGIVIEPISARNNLTGSDAINIVNITPTYPSPVKIEQNSTCITPIIQQ